MKQLIAGIAAAAALGVVATAQGAILGPTPYLQASDSPFAGETFSKFYLENFEDGLLNTPGVSATPGWVVSNPNAFNDSVDADDGAINGFGTAGHSFYSNNHSSLTFTFSAAVLGSLPTHAGIVWTDVGYDSERISFGTVIFEAFDATNTSLGTRTAFLGDGLSTGQTAEDRFFGAINAGGISKIVISMPNSGDWEVDHLQYGVAAAVPEASTFALMGLGLAGLGLASRRCRSRT